MPRLNNEERNQAIGKLNTVISATAVSRHFGCTRKNIERLWRRFRVAENVADRHRSGRPCVSITADDLIVLQHIRNKHVLQQPGDNMVFIHTVCWGRTVSLFVRTDHTLVIFSPDVKELQGWIVPPSPALPKCQLGFGFVFRRTWESIAVGESVLPMGASLSGTVSVVFQS